MDGLQYVYNQMHNLSYKKKIIKINKSNSPIGSFFFFWLSKLLFVLFYLPYWKSMIFNLHFLFSQCLIIKIYYLDFWSFSGMSYFHSFYHCSLADTRYFLHGISNPYWKMTSPSSLSLPDTSVTWPGHATSLLKDLSRHLLSL